MVSVNRATLGIRLSENITSARDEDYEGKDMIGRVCRFFSARNLERNLKS